MEKNYRVVFTEKSKIELQECEMPTPKENELLLKAIVTQISTGTELTRLEQNISEDSSWKDLGSYMQFPIYPGYSFVGEVVAVGENCDKSLIGRRVVSSNGHRKYAAVNAESVHFLPENVDPDDAAFKTLAVVALASIRAAKIKPGETAVVFGAGIVGQLVARLAQIAGAVNVVVVDVSDNRLKFVPKNKCFYAVNSTKENVEEFVKNINNGNLADIVFETTAYPPLIEAELKCLTKRGRLVITSSPKGPSKVDFQYCSSAGITIISAHNYAFHAPTATPENPWTIARDGEYVIELLEKELLSLKDMVTHKESYKNAVETYDFLMKDRTQALAVHFDWRD